MIPDRIKKIKLLNKLLVSQFGIPKRNPVLPDPVDLLIATILSQNTNDNNSYKAFINLKKRFATWESAAVVARRQIEKEIRIAGLAFQKSKAIKEFLIRILNENKAISLEHLRDAPSFEIIDYLTGFYGIGVKTASCVLLFAFDRNICPVDTHVHRTLNRIGIIKASAPDKTFYELNGYFPSRIAHQFHTNLIRLGREICKSPKPNCSLCRLNEMCTFEKKNFSAVDNVKSRNFMLLDNINS